MSCMTLSPFFVQQGVSISARTTPTSAPMSIRDLFNLMSLAGAGDRRNFPFQKLPSCSTWIHRGVYVGILFPTAVKTWNRTFYTHVTLHCHDFCASTFNREVMFWINWHYLKTRWCALISESNYIVWYFHSSISALEATRGSVSCSVSWSVSCSRLLHPISTWPVTTHKIYTKYFWQFSQQEASKTSFLNPPPCCPPWPFMVFFFLTCPGVHSRTEISGRDSALGPSSPEWAALWQLYGS